MARQVYHYQNPMISQAIAGLGDTFINGPARAAAAERQRMLTEEQIAASQSRRRKSDYDLESAQSKDAALASLADMVAQQQEAAALQASVPALAGQALRAGEVDSMGKLVNMLMQNNAGSTDQQRIGAWLGAGNSANANNAFSIEGQDRIRRAETDQQIRLEQAKPKSEGEVLAGMLDKYVTSNPDFATQVVQAKYGAKPHNAPAGTQVLLPQGSPYAPDQGGTSIQVAPKPSAGGGLPGGGINDPLDNKRVYELSYQAAYQALQAEGMAADNPALVVPTTELVQRVLLQNPGVSPVQAARLAIQQLKVSDPMIGDRKATVGVDQALPTLLQALGVSRPSAPAPAPAPAAPAGPWTRFANPQQ